MTPTTAPTIYVFKNNVNFFVKFETSDDRFRTSHRKLTEVAERIEEIVLLKNMNFHIIFRAPHHAVVEPRFNDPKPTDICYDLTQAEQEKIWSMFRP